MLALLLLGGFLLTGNAQMAGLLADGSVDASSSSGMTSSEYRSWFIERALIGFGVVLFLGCTFIVAIVVFMFVQYKQERDRFV